MARAIRPRRTSSSGARFGFRRSGGSSFSQDIPVTILSYHFGESENAAPEDDYMVVSLLGSVKNYGKEYPAGTEFKVFFNKPEPVKGGRSPRNTVRALSRKTNMPYSTGDALVEGSDVMLAGAKFVERGDETVIVPRLGRGLVAGPQKWIQLTDGDGNPLTDLDDDGKEVPTPTLCGKTYANVQGIVHAPQSREYTRDGETVTRNTMAITLLHTDRAVVIDDGADVRGKIKSALLEHAFNDPEEDPDWGRRGVIVFAAKKAPANLSDAQREAFYEDFDNEPLNITITAYKLRSEGDGDNAKGDYIDWSEDGVAETDAAIERVEKGDFDDAKRYREAIDDAENYIITIVPVTGFNFRSSLIPGYVSPEGDPLFENYFKIGCVIEADQAYNDHEPLSYTFPGSRNSRERGVYVNTEQSDVPGVLTFDAIVVTRDVGYFDNKSLSDESRLRNEPYRDLMEAKYRVLQYPFASVGKVYLPLVWYRPTKDAPGEMVNLPRRAPIFVEDLVAPGQPKAYVEAHQKNNLAQQDMLFSYRVEKGLVETPQGWPQDDGTNPLMTKPSEDHVDEGGAEEASAAEDTGSSSNGSGWDAGSGDDDEIPF